MIKFCRISLLFVSLLAFREADAQIDSLIVEKYYISDANDATDETGGGLPNGSVTYRIYVDLAPGSRLLKIYGDEDHQIRITSTTAFFNNIPRGRSIGKDIRVNRLRENTVALDTWITIGLATEGHNGILKVQDTDGSIVGGINNNGGSALIPGGLLVNSDPAAGIPLTTADGLATATILPQNWLAILNGSDLAYTTDSTIFGSLKSGNSFISNDFILSNNGVSGVTSVNRVLIAQLTTTGDLSFSLNVEVEENNGPIPVFVKYVAENPAADEKTNRFLIYPTPPPPTLICGCKDKDYVEYNKTLDCHVQDSCKKLIVYGCKDPYACNYDPNVTFNIPSLCCYPGGCNNRDIRIICPKLNGTQLGASVYPNPASDNLKIELDNADDKEVVYVIYNSTGSPLLTDNLGKSGNKMVNSIDISFLSKGYYFIEFFCNGKTLTKSFIKK